MEDKHVQVGKHKREHRRKVRKRGIKEKAAKSAKHWVRKTEKKGKRNKQSPADGGGCTPAARPSPTSTYSWYMS